MPPVYYPESLEVPADATLYQQTLGTLPPLLFAHYERLQRQMLVFQMAVIASTSIILWEHVVLFPAELTTWKALLKGRIMPARLAVIAVRYLVIAAIVFALLLMFGEPASCKMAVVTVYSLYTALVAVASSIFLMRLHIIMTGHPYIMAGYYVLFVLNIAAWVVIDSNFDGVEIPVEFRAPGGVKCAPKPVPWYAVFAWGSNLIFDAATLIGTYWKLRTIRHNNGLRRALENRTHRFIWRSNLLYFGVSCAFNVGCLVTELTAKSPTYSHLPSPIAFCAHTVISSRLLLTAKGWGNLDQEDDLEHHHDQQAYGLTDRRTTPSRRPMPTMSFKVEELVTVHGAEGEHDLRSGHLEPPVEHHNNSHHHHHDGASYTSGSTYFNMDTNSPANQHQHLEKDNVTAFNTTPPQGRWIGSQENADSSGKSSRGHEWTMGLAGRTSDPRRRSSGSHESSEMSEAERKRAAALEQTIRATYPRLSGFMKSEHLKSASSSSTPTTSRKMSGRQGPDISERPSTAGAETSGMASPRASSVVLSASGERMEVRRSLVKTSAGPSQARIDSPFQDPNSTMEHCEEEEEASHQPECRSEPASDETPDLVREPHSRPTPRTSIQLGRTSTFGHGSLSGTDDTRSVDTSPSSHRTGPAQPKRSEEIETSSTVQPHGGDGGDMSVELRSPLSDSMSLQSPTRLEATGVGSRGRTGGIEPMEERDQQVGAYSLSAAAVSQVSCRIGHGAGSSLELPCFSPPSRQLALMSSTSLSREEEEDGDELAGSAVERDDASSAHVPRAI